MKLGLSLLFLLSLVSFDTNVAAEKCLTLDNEEARIWKLGAFLPNFKDMLGIEITPEEFKQLVHKIKNPGIGKCLANLELDSIMKKFGSNKQCIEATSITKMDEIRKNPIPDRKKGEDISLYIIRIAKWLSEYESEDHKKICGEIVNNVSPCVMNTILPELAKILKKGESCCKEFNQIMKENFASDLISLIKTIVPRLSKSICSVKTLGYNDDKDGSTCSYIIMQSIVKTFPVPIIQILNIPNKEACKAFTGKKYINFDKKETQLNEPKQALDVCTKESDSLISMIGNFPIIQQNEIGKNLFGDNCVENEKFVKYLEEYMGDDALKLSIILPKCLNIPNGYSNTCTYKGKLSMSIYDKKDNDDDKKDNDDAKKDNDDAKKDNDDAKKDNDDGKKDNDDDKDRKSNGKKDDNSSSNVIPFVSSLSFLTVAITYWL